MKANAIKSPHSDKSTSGQDGDVGKHASPPHTTTARITTRLKNKYHPELSENQAVWKFNNNGFREATFLQKAEGAEMQGWAER